VRICVLTINARKQAATASIRAMICSCGKDDPPEAGQQYFQMLAVLRHAASAGVDKAEFSVCVDGCVYVAGASHGIRDDADDIDVCAAGANDAYAGARLRGISSVCYHDQFRCPEWECLLQRLAPGMSPRGLPAARGHLAPVCERVPAPASSSSKHTATLPHFPEAIREYASLTSSRANL